MRFIQTVCIRTQSWSAPVLNCIEPYLEPKVVQPLWFQNSLDKKLVSLKYSCKNFVLRLILSEILLGLHLKTLKWDTVPANWQRHFPSVMKS